MRRFQIVLFALIAIGLAQVTVPFYGVSVIQTSGTDSTATSGLIHDSAAVLRSEMGNSIPHSAAFIGNSMTVGQWILGSNGYGAILCSMVTPPWAYYKMAVNGRLSETMLDSIGPALADSVGIVIIGAGAADGHADSATAVYTISNIAAMIESCRVHYKPVGVWTILPDSSYSEGLGGSQYWRRYVNNWIRSDTCFADFKVDGEFVLGDGSSMRDQYSEDNRHTNPKGDTVLARMWSTVLQLYKF